jgi:hypothetical protein
VMALGLIVAAVTLVLADRPQPAKLRQ